ncbi:unnamed protein product, partial [Ectocarpus sp. 13 AM-2016]
VDDYSACGRPKQVANLTTATTGAAGREEKEKKKRTKQRAKHRNETHEHTRVKFGGNNVCSTQEKSEGKNARSAMMMDDPTPPLSVQPTHGISGLTQQRRGRMINNELLVHR